MDAAEILSAAGGLQVDRIAVNLRRMKDVALVPDERSQVRSECGVFWADDWALLQRRKMGWHVSERFKLARDEDGSALIDTENAFIEAPVA
jgi:hypothetical protein